MIVCRWVEFHAWCPFDQGESSRGLGLTSRSSRQATPDAKRCPASLGGTGPWLLVEVQEGEKLLICRLRHGSALNARRRTRGAGEARSLRRGGDAARVRRPGRRASRNGPGVDGAVEGGERSADGRRPTGRKLGGQGGATPRCEGQHAPLSVVGCDTCACRLLFLPTPEPVPRKGSCR